MTSQSRTTALRDITFKENVYSQKANNKENFDQTNFLSSPATTDGNDLNANLFEPAALDQENINNNKTQNSKQKRKKKAKRLKSKSPVASSENITLDDLDNTTSSRRSDVWKFAIRNVDKNFSTCTLCDDQKQISTNNGSTSTLRKHLITVHGLHYLALPVKQKKDSTKLSISLNKKRDLDDLFINCIIKDGRAFSDFQKPGIKKIFHELVPDYQPPNRFSVARQLRYLHSFHYKKLINELADIDYISITTDFWSNRKMRSFLVITGHYFNANDFSLRSKILDFSTFDFQHKANEISKILQTKLAALNIEHKITRVTADGAPNMVRAIDDLELDTERFWCFAHRLHLTIVNAFGFWVTKKDDDQEISIENEEYRNNATTDYDEVVLNAGNYFVHDMKMDVEEDSESMINHSMEIEHINEQQECLNQVFGEDIIDSWVEGVNVSDVGFDKEQEKIILLVKKCRGLVHTIKRSTNITLFFDNERKKRKIIQNLCYDIKCRWNSTYLMIDSFIALRSVIETLFYSKHLLTITRKQLDTLSTFEFTTDDWIMLSTLHLFLQRFFNATNAISVRQYPSIGTAFYLLTRLKNFLQYHDRSDTLLLKRLKQIILPYFIRYFESDANQLQLLKFHAYFDPVGFLVLNDSEKRSIEQTIKLMVVNDGSDSTQQETVVSTQSSVDPITTSSSQSIKPYGGSTATAMDIFNESVGEYHFETTPSVYNKRPTITEEIHNYRKCVNQFNVNRRPDAKLSTLFWQSHAHTFSILTKLAKKFLPTPSTSVASESCFSLSSYLGRKERARLTGENLSSSVFLKDKIDF